MIWLLTAAFGLVAAYTILCLMIGSKTGGSSQAPYWVLLLVSVTVLWVAWYHPMHITFL